MRIWLVVALNLKDRGAITSKLLFATYLLDVLHLKAGLETAQCCDRQVDTGHVLA